MNITIRHEHKYDYNRITEITDLAFGQPNEGLMVEKIRRNSLFIKELSLVALFNNKIVGHILFFSIFIVSKKDKYKSISLAPVSVHPDYQNKGIGDLLIKHGLTGCREHGFSSCI